MKVAALVSGGVDSSVALAKVVSEGHDVSAFYLKIWLEDEAHFLGDCPWEEDLGYVRAVCDKLKVPLEIIPLQAEYHDRVISYVVSELKAGRTPSPDIFCNHYIKFGAFLDRIDFSFEKVVTGHYAIVEDDGLSTHLKLANDRFKDQTYFLSHLDADQLKRCMFPLGGLAKKDVRKIAASLDLPTKDRPDSQGICFLGKIPYLEFVRFHLGEKEGEIREEESDRVLGLHAGVWFHTIGQRKGLGLSGGPWFVVRKDLEKNIVYVGHKEVCESFAQKTFYVRDYHWIGDEPESSGLFVKLRHGEHRYSCVIDRQNDRIRVDLDKKDQGIAPGQFAVFYQNENCLGCGIIQ